MVEAGLRALDVAAVGHVYLQRSPALLAWLAEQLGQDVNRIFKTLVLHGDRSGYFVCVIPGGDEVDLKKAAKASGNKSCSMIAVKELLPLTGYIRGGCSPVGMKKKFKTVISREISCSNST